MPRLSKMLSGLVVVLSGPSGVGKTTISRCLMRDPLFRFSISATTRPPRENEKDGVDYHFLSLEEFRAKISADGFVEYVEVYEGVLYGTLRAPLDEAVASGEVMLLDIDVDGSEKIRAMNYPLLRIFISPPDYDELAKRLKGRGTDDEKSIEKRMKRWKKEMECGTSFDLKVVNDDLGACIESVHRAIAARYLRGPTED
ncbi:MAG: guanylate kinase [Planctomycetes bacterium]|nr:guanylate kinase [Planctomycetota bacterium]